MTDPTPEEALRWNAAAVRHAEAVTDGRAASLFASLYLNLGDSLANVGETAASADAVRRAGEHLAALPPGEYRELVASGIGRLAERVGLAGTWTEVPNGSPGSAGADPTSPR